MGRATEIGERAWERLKPFISCCRIPWR